MNKPPNYIHLYCLLILICFCSVIKCNLDAKRLYDDLFSNYNHLVRPVINDSQPVKVQIKLKLSQLIEVINLIDEMGSIYTIIDSSMINESGFMILMVNVYISVITTINANFKNFINVNNVLAQDSCEDLFNGQYPLDINLKDQIMTTSMWVEHYWEDQNLKWSPENYNGIKFIHLESDKIWRPDIVLYNNAAADFEVVMATKAKLNYKGEIVWSPPAIYKSSCEIDVEWFPFDEQICRMKYGSWTYDGYKVDLRHLDEQPDKPEVELGIDLSDFHPSVEWDLIEVPARRNSIHYLCCDSPYLDLTFNISMRRKTLFYTVNLILPCSGISALSVLVFYLPSDSGEKISLSVSILVALTVFFLLLAETIPPTSLTIPFLGKYLLFTMILVGLSICVTVIVLNIHFRSGSTHHMSHSMRFIFLEVLPKFLFMKRPEYQFSHCTYFDKRIHHSCSDYPDQSLNLSSAINSINQNNLDRKRNRILHKNSVNIKSICSNRIKTNSIRRDATNRNLITKFNGDASPKKTNEQILSKKKSNKLFTKSKSFSESNDGNQNEDESENKNHDANKENHNLDCEDGQSRWNSEINKDDNCESDKDDEIENKDFRNDQSAKSNGNSTKNRLQRSPSKRNFLSRSECTAPSSYLTNSIYSLHSIDEHRLNRNQVETELNNQIGNSFNSIQSLCDVESLKEANNDQNNNYFNKTQFNLDSNGSDQLDNELNSQFRHHLPEYLNRNKFDMNDQNYVNKSIIVKRSLHDSLEQTNQSSEDRSNKKYEFPFGSTLNHQTDYCQINHGKIHKINQNANQFINRNFDQSKEQKIDTSVDKHLNKSDESHSKKISQQVIKQYSDSAIARNHQISYYKNHYFNKSIDQAMFNQSSISKFNEANFRQPSDNSLVHNQQSIHNSSSINQSIDRSSTKKTDDETVFLDALHRIERNPHIMRAMTNVNFLAEHTRKSVLEEEIKEDYKYIAMVLDRLFLLIFLIACLFGSFSIILLDQQHPEDSKLTQLTSTLYNKTSLMKIIWGGD